MKKWHYMIAIVGALSTNLTFANNCALVHGNSGYAKNLSIYQSGTVLYSDTIEIVESKGYNVTPDNDYIDVSEWNPDGTIKLPKLKKGDRVLFESSYKGNRKECTSYVAIEEVTGYDAFGSPYFKNIFKVQDKATSFTFDIPVIGSPVGIHVGTSACDKARKLVFNKIIKTLPSCL